MRANTFYGLPMGFLKPDLPVVDFPEWSKGTRAEKIRPMARHWAEVGFGTPVALHLFYVVKILLYILGGARRRVDGVGHAAIVDRLAAAGMGSITHSRPGRCARD